MRVGLAFDYVARNPADTVLYSVDGDSLDSLRSARCATVSGFSVHAKCEYRGPRSSSAGTIGALRQPARGIDRAVVATAGRSPSVPIEATMAQRNHGSCF